MPAPLISIIIPCLNDADALTRCLRRLEGAGEDVEIIVADASESESCRDIARLHGVTALHCTRRGRGPQMNEGAALATGDVLLFLHADTDLGQAHLASLRQALAVNSPPWQSGAYFKDIPAHYPEFAWAEPIARYYSRILGILYGDQACFLRRSHFHALQGFADIPLMEDVELSSRLRRAGGLIFLDPPLRTSMRRFQKKGYLRTKLQNILLVFLFRCGLSPRVLYQWYYGKPSVP